DAARLGEVLRVLVGQERTPGVRSLTAVERTFVHMREHLVEHRIEKDRLEILCGGACFRGNGRGNIRRRECRRRTEGDGRAHHITSMSACIAPAALIACRIAIMSRGPMPS